MKLSLPFILAAALVAAGCASTSALNSSDAVVMQAETVTTAMVSEVRSAELIEKDRAAIRAFAGEYVVTFAFDETVPLIEGYEKKDPKRSGATEVVLLVEDSPDKIILQHILYMGDHIIKHWRQDWTYEADHRLDFVDDQTWQTVALTEEQTAGKWTQCVYGVYDNPRYCGTGAWNHRYGNPTWTSDRHWRVLPRREYTTRDDYNVMHVENRHTITPAGWTHEQDNTKVIRSENGNQVLVREFGFNEYRRTEDIDFQPAYDYWEATKAFWATVREKFDQMIEQGGVEIKVTIDSMDAIEAMFGLASRVEEGDNPSLDEIQQAFAEYFQPVEPGIQLAASR